MEQIHAVILAAGRSERLGNVDKLWVSLNGKPLIQWSIEAFIASSEISGITLVTRPETVERLTDIVGHFQDAKPISIVIGGATRMESVHNACCEVNAPYIAVHDGARPMITTDLIDAVCIAARGNDCACLSLPVVDTIVRSTSHTEIERIPRSDLYTVQTPQVIRTDIWLQGKVVADERGVDVTDDTHMATIQGKSVVHVPGDRTNIKVTYADDIQFAEQLMKQSPPIEYRTGFGYDIHRTASDRECYLGGVRFEDSKVGLLGHSDADVLLHAICDALLGAAALGDIGVHFPPSDDSHKGRASTEFLTEVNQLLRDHGWVIGNIDATVIAEAPKVMPKATEMRAHISGVLNIPVDRVSIKATTNEGLGALGHGDGIAAHAVAMVYR
jgi:2-C-methyl-D-erythritol 2,4-cyclodiphosphate synthase/2-C-methyl-D-erythritol 4-phosphate cytidylyltransferase